MPIEFDEIGHPAHGSAVTVGSLAVAHLGARYILVSVDGNDACNVLFGRDLRPFGQGDFVLAEECENSKSGSR